MANGTISRCSQFVPTLYFEPVLTFVVYFSNGWESPTIKVECVWLMGPFLSIFQPPPSLSIDILVGRKSNIDLRKKTYRRKDQWTYSIKLLNNHLNILINIAAYCSSTIVETIHFCWLFSNDFWVIFLWKFYRDLKKPFLNFLTSGIF